MKLTVLLLVLGLLSCTTAKSTDAPLQKLQLTPNWFLRRPFAHYGCKMIITASKR